MYFGKRLENKKLTNNIILSWQKKIWLGFSKKSNPGILRKVVRNLQIT